MINLNKFKELNLRIAKILKAERIKGSEKLLVLDIDLGDEKRQLVAGIANFYSPEDLIDKEIVVVANLEPKVLMGTESQGMLLAADVDGRPVLLRPEEEVPPGTTIR